MCCIESRGEVDFVEREEIEIAIPLRLALLNRHSTSFLSVSLSTIAMQVAFLPLFFLRQTLASSRFRNKIPAPKPVAHRHRRTSRH